MKFKRVLALLFSLTMIFLTGAIPVSAADRQFVIPQKFTETIDGEKQRIRFPIIPEPKP